MVDLGGRSWESILGLDSGGRFWGSIVGVDPGGDSGGRFWAVLFEFAVVCMLVCFLAASGSKPPQRVAMASGWPDRPKTRPGGERWAHEAPTIELVIIVLRINHVQF